MLNYTIRRLFFVLFVVWGVSLATFFISQVVPGDPALVALGDKATDEMIANFRVKNGLDQPIVAQYFNYVGRLLQGNLGTSLRTGRPIIDDLRDFFPGTLELSITALLIAALIGICGHSGGTQPEQSPRFYHSVFGIAWRGNPNLLVSDFVARVFAQQTAYFARTWAFGCLLDCSNSSHGFCRD